MIGPPEPKVLADHVIGVNRHHALRLAGPRSAHPATQIVQAHRILSPAGAGSRPADLHERFRLARTGVNQQAADDHAFAGLDDQRRLARGGDETGKAQAENDRVRPGHHDAFVQLVNARREQEILSLASRRFRLAAVSFSGWAR